MTKTINFKIVTPEKVVYEDDVDSITIPTKSGEITILPNHAPLISALQAGEMIVKKEGAATYMAVTGGFLQVQANSKVIILADTAEREEEISEQQAEEAKTRAQQLLQEKKLSKEELATVAATLERSLAQLKVIRRRRK